MTEERASTRRSYLTALATGGTFALAGCADGGGNNGGGGGNIGNRCEGVSGGEVDSSDIGGGDYSGTVAIGSDIPYRPFEYTTAAGNLVGFDVEIAYAVFGEQLGLEPMFERTSFDGIIPSLNNGNFRVIMSAMTINEQRDEEVDFSDPYFTAYQTIAVLEDSGITSREDLKGKAVGVQKGTTGEGAAEELKPEFDGDLTIQSYDQITGAFDALLNNQVSAVINDNTVTADFVSQNDNVRFVEGEGVAAKQRANAPPYLTLTVEEYGIAFREDDDLRQEVNDALTTVMEEDTYDEIYAKYFCPDSEN
jgi:polar amino acid transport system substrate-binding protein